VAQVVRGTLKANLLFGNNSVEIHDKELWRLCRICGMSPGFIGHAYSHSWSDFRVEPAAMSGRVMMSDLIKLVLVRTLLMRPDVLLLHHVGEVWSQKEQKALANVLRSYINESLDRHLGEWLSYKAKRPTIGDPSKEESPSKGRSTHSALGIIGTSSPLHSTRLGPNTDEMHEAFKLIQARIRGARARKKVAEATAYRRTVVWCASDTVLDAVLAANDNVLTIETPALMSLLTMKEALDPTGQPDAPATTHAMGSRKSAQPPLRAHGVLPPEGSSTAGARASSTAGVGSGLGQGLKAISEGIRDGEWSSDAEGSPEKKKKKST